MTRYLFKTLGIHLRAGKTLYALTVLGVALGVAAILSIQIINRNALAAFRGSVDAVSGNSDLTITSANPTFSERVLLEVLEVPGIRAAWPHYRLEVLVEAADPLYLEVVGLDLLAPIDLPWSEDRGITTTPLANPAWLAVTPELARERGWQVGDSVRVSSGTRGAYLEVGGLIDFKQINALATSRLAVMDIAAAQSLLGESGSIHQINVIASEGTPVEEVAEILRSRLDERFRIATPEQQVQQAANLLGAFRLNLTALSLISLLVGAFLVYASVQAALVRRRAEFGLLRCLGSTRGQVVLVILAEVLLLAFLGVGIGLPVGYWAARLNVEVVSSTLSNIYLLTEIEALTLPWDLYLLASLIGLAGALGGALLPAWDMSRQDTKSLLASLSLEERVKTAATPLLVAGWAVLAGAALWYVSLGKDWRPSGFVLAVALLIALPLMTPALMRAVTRSVRVVGFGLSYSLRSVGQRLQTTAFSVAALSIAVSMLVGITLMVQSFRSTVDVWIQGTVRADVYVSSSSWRGTSTEAIIDSSIVRRLINFEGVRAADRLRASRTAVNGLDVPLVAVEMQLPGGEERFTLWRGDPGEAFGAAARGGILISEPLARRAQLTLGDTARITTPRGKAHLPVAGVYYDYRSESGAAAIDLETMRRLFGPGEINNVALYLEGDRDPGEFIDDLKSRFSGLPLDFRSNREIRTQALEIFDQTFAITRLLQVMSLIIAASSVTLTLLILGRELRPELALYSALGAVRSQILRIFLGKGLIMGIISIGAGLIGGALLAAILIFVINRAYFGWTIRPAVPVGAVSEEIITILAAVILASLYPAVRASQTPATDLTRDAL